MMSLPGGACRALPTGIHQEHIAVRSDVGLFDVSRMGELRVVGDDATAFLSSRR